MSNPQPFTIYTYNGMLRRGHFSGTYATAELARERMQRMAATVRAFVTFRVWTGTPQAPGKATEHTADGAR